MSADNTQTPTPQPDPFAAVKAKLADEAYVRSLTPSEINELFSQLTPRSNNPWRDAKRGQTTKKGSR